MTKASSPDEVIAQSSNLQGGCKRLDFARASPGIVTLQSARLPDSGKRLHKAGVPAWPSQEAPEPQCRLELQGEPQCNQQRREAEKSTTQARRGNSEAGRGNTR